MATEEKDYDNQDCHITTIKQASRVAFVRLIIYGIILVATLATVYTTIKNPDFLYNALSFKSIEDDEAVKKLVSYSNEISQEKTNYEKIVAYRNKAEEINKLINNDNSGLYRIIFSYGVSTKIIDNGEVDDPIKLPVVIRYKPIGKSFIPDNEESLLFSKSIDFSEEEYKKYIDYKKSMINKFFGLNFSKSPNYDSIVIRHLSNNNESREIFQNKYKIVLSKNLASLNDSLLASDVEIKSLNENILKVIKKIRSNEFIFLSIIFQKILITVFIVSIGLYFLKAIGTELLFIRKLSVVKISQSLINEKNEYLTKDSILFYNAIIGKDERIEKEANSIPINTIDKVAKILSLHKKNEK